MFIGQTLVAENVDPDGNGRQANTSIVYSPWIPSGGESVVFGLEVLALSDTINRTGAQSEPELKIWVQSKNSEETDGSGTFDTSSSVTMNSTGSSSIEMSDLNELVRLKFELKDNASGSGDAMERVFYCVFRANNPSWASN